MTTAVLLKLYWQFSMWNYKGYIQVNNNIMYERFKLLSLKYLKTVICWYKQNYYQNLCTTKNMLTYLLNSFGIINRLMK